MRRFDRLHPTLASLVLAAVLLATNARYGYHRDELYFRMLEPSWGYADQPPLTPLIARGAVAAFGDSVWAMRLPAVLCMVAVLWIAALIARELGGGRGAQALCVWGLAFAGVALAFGHTLATATVDLVVWTLVLLFAIRALMRDPRWWLAVGAATGVGLYNKHLVVLLLLSLGAALLAVGPRRALTSKWLWAGAGLALAIGAPNLVYQAAHGWPQLDMAAAINETDGAENRVLLLPFQFLLLGAFLVPVWAAGIWALLRDPAWRPVRALAVAYPVLLAVVLATGGQFYYPMGLVIALYAAGCVPVAAWARRRSRRGLLLGAVALNAAVSAVVALPLVPVARLGDTPIPDMNSTVPDQVGWETYVEQIREAAAGLPDGAMIVTANYGEAGAIDRFGADLPPVYSGHNALHEYGPPPAGTETVLAVGMPLERLAPLFASCEAVASLDNGIGVDNEEQGETVAVCTGPVEPWNELWEEFQHYS